eukprot:2991634-Amphidinium_carterae.2
MSLPFSGSGTKPICRMAKGSRKKPAASTSSRLVRQGVVQRRVATVANKKPSFALRSRRKIERARVLTVVKQDWLNFCLAGERWKADREIVLAAVQQDGCVLEYAAESCRRDCEI